MKLRLILMVGALMLMGCGGNSEADEAKQVVLDANAAFEQGDLVAGCANFTDLTDCEKLVDALLQVDVEPLPPSDEISGIQVDGDQAEVEFEDDPSVSLVKQDGWKIDLDG